MRYFNIYLICAAGLTLFQPCVKSDPFYTGTASPYLAFSDNPVAVAYGRYQKTLSAIASRKWMAEFRSHPSSTYAGKVTVEFAVNKDGKVIRTKITSTTRNHQLEQICVKSILSSTFPPIPDDLVSLITDGTLNIWIDVGVSIIPNTSNP